MTYKCGNCNSTYKPDQEQIRLVKNNVAEEHCLCCPDCEDIGRAHNNYIDGLLNSPDY